MSIDDRNTGAQRDELSDDALEAVSGGVAGLSALVGLGGNDVGLTGGPKPITPEPSGLREIGGSIQIS